MRVICPRCGAEYEIDDQLIPANGREVECSSCDNVWFQPGRLRMPEPLARLPLTARTDQNGSGAQAGAPDHADHDEPADDSFAQPAPPDLPHRRPSAEALKILRDEAARFRASRPGIEVPEDGEDADGITLPDRQDPSPAAAPPQHEAAPYGPGSAGPKPQGDHPAKLSDPEAASGEKDGASADPPVAAATSADFPTRTTAVPTAEMSESDTPSAARPIHSFDGRDDRLPATDAQGDAAASRPAPPRRRGFGTGFAIGVLIAAILAGLYAAAPLAGDGWLGDMLQGLRGIGDDFHHWVQNHLAGLR